MLPQQKALFSRNKVLPIVDFDGRSHLIVIKLKNFLRKEFPIGKTR